MLTWLFYNALACLPFVVIALAIERLAPRRTTLVQLVWTLALMRLVAPPLTWLSTLPWAQGGAPAASAATAGSSGLTTSGTSSFGRDVMAWMFQTFGGNWSGHLRTGALVGLIAGAALLWLSEAWRARRLHVTLRDARAPGTEVRLRVGALARELGVAMPALVVLPGIASPFLYGSLMTRFLRFSEGSRRGPAALLVLPPDAADLPRTVLAHELIHLRRRDHWRGWLELIVLGLQWWNPLAWAVRRRAHLATELACDREVVRRYPAEREEYARALLRTLERDAGLGSSIATEPQPMGATRAIGWSADELASRFERILSTPAAASAGRALPSAAVLLFVLSLPGVGAPSVSAFRDALPPLPNGLADEEYQRIVQQADAALARDPSDGAALALRGRALLGMGRFESGARDFEAQLALGHEAATAAYNAACAHALRGAHALALERLAQALELGAPREYLALDRDLDALRGHPVFERLLALSAE